MCVCVRERERETARCLHTNLLFWLGVLEYWNTMFGSVNQSCYNCLLWGPKTQTHRAHRLLYGKVGYSTVLTLCVVSIACTHFWIGEAFYHEYHSGLIWIQTVFANVKRERGRERERLVQARQSKHCIGGSASRERERGRERERCACVWVFFNFVSLFFLL